MAENYTIETYLSENEKIWDEFVENNSVNGTFLHTRRFLNYHPEGRFEDSSLLVRDKNQKLVAVVPGCIQYEDGMKLFYSHKGSTFGGLVISHDVYFAESLAEIVECVQEYLKAQGFQRVIYKVTPDIFSTEKNDLLEYILYYEGYMEQKELNLYIDYDAYDEDTIKMVSRRKRRSILCCADAGLELRPLTSDDEICQMHHILELSLQKYSLKPIHTPLELIRFRDVVIPKECGFYGLYLEDRMVAGAMMFYFHNASTAHAQNICALPEYNKKLSPSTYMFFSMIEEMRRKGFQRLSWGISSEHGGKEINWGITQSKEEYGSRHAVNRIFSKML